MERDSSSTSLASMGTHRYAHLNICLCTWHTNTAYTYPYTHSKYIQREKFTLNIYIILKLRIVITLSNLYYPKNIVENSVIFKKKNPNINRKLQFLQVCVWGGGCFLLLLLLTVLFYFFPVFLLIQELKSEVLSPVTLKCPGKLLSQRRETGRPNPLTPELGSKLQRKKEAQRPTVSQEGVSTRTSTSSTKSQLLEFPRHHSNATMIAKLNLSQTIL